MSQAVTSGLVCESYVTKPIDPAELLARMQHLGLLSSEATTCGNA
ncbi:MAG: hypothetical protein ABIK89_02370 [Planctomycetota bacterium]